MQLIQGLDNLLQRETKNGKLAERLLSLRAEIAELTENIFKACDMEEVSSHHKLMNYQ